MREILRKLFWRILGIDYCHILKNVDFVYLKEDEFATIGKGTYENGAKVWRWTNAKLDIGDYCSIAYDVCFIMDEGGHTSSPITSSPFFKTTSKRGIKIGNAVWIGQRAIIMPGVRIGNGVTIGANAVVTKDVSDFAVVVGVPAKVIKYQLTVEQIEDMNRIAWWNWGKKQIENRKGDFLLSPDEFISKYK